MNSQIETDSGWETEADVYVYHVFVKSGFDVANKHIGKVCISSWPDIGDELNINPLSSPTLIQQWDDIRVDYNCFVGGGIPKLVSHNGAAWVTVIDICSAEDAGIREDAFPCIVVEGEIELMADDRTLYVGPGEDGHLSELPYADQLNEILLIPPEILILNQQYENARKSWIEEMEAMSEMPKYAWQLSLFFHSSRV